MEELVNLFHGFVVVLQPYNIMLMFVGILFGVIMITLVAPLVAKFALQFGPAEKFAVFFLAFCSFIGMGKEPPFKTVASMMIGFALAAVGLDSVTGQLRLTFGFTELLTGFDFLI